MSLLSSHIHDVCDLSIASVRPAQSYKSVGADSHQTTMSSEKGEMISRNLVEMSGILTMWVHSFQELVHALRLGE